MHILSDMVGKMVYHSEKPIQHLLDLQWIRQEQGLVSENVRDTILTSFIIRRISPAVGVGRFIAPIIPAKSKGTAKDRNLID